MIIQAILRKILPHIVAIFAMLIVSSVYFYPAWEGKSLQGEDVIGGIGKVQERQGFQEYENESSLWYGSIFSGMPDFIGAPYKGASSLKKVFFIPQRLGIPREIVVLFWYMIGFYILLISFKIPPMLSTGGAMGFALTSYYIIIILAGHYTKAYTLALIPPALGGILMCFNRRYLWGFITTSFFLSTAITMAHIQMIYYFLIALIIIGIVELYYHIKEKELIRFTKTILIIFAASILAVAPNSSRLLSYYKYNDYSIRGSSELTIGKETTKTKNGLDKDYINSWSSGVDESMMVLVPNTKGGSTSYIKQNRELLTKIPQQYRSTIGNFNQYWGDQIFSGGPSYLGTVYLLLFLLGIFLIKGRIIWALFFPSILFFLLSMGGNLSAFTDLFIYYVPMYNKFRAPVSVLAIATIFTSLVAIYTLYQLVDNKELLAKAKKINIFKTPQPIYLLVSTGVLVFLVFNIVFPEVFNTYLSHAETVQFDSYRQQPNAGNQIDGIINTVVDFRIGVFRADLWRALLFTVLLTGAIYLFAKNKIKKNILILFVVVLAIIDFWGVGRRYVSIDHFTKTQSQVKKAYELTDYDKQIYQNELSSSLNLRLKLEEYNKKFTPKNETERNRLRTHVINKFSHYRVFNTINSPFQENFTASAHKSIGGYHAAKLRRYQDLIEYHISKMNIGVLNMLNTKYIISSNGLQNNAGAFGSAWFVDSIHWVNNANEEILALNKVNLSTTAVVNKKNKNDVSTISASSDINNDSIQLMDYNPDKLKYKVKTGKQRYVVFSEIYYPDWKVWIDGEESTIIQTNYVLRGLVIPAGEHIVEFKFHPKHYYLSNSVSQIALYFLLVMLVIAIFWSLYQSRHEVLLVKEKYK